MNIGDRIKQRRLELNLDVEELAKRIGKSRATVYRYENGDIENMPTTVLEPIAKALNTTPAYLMGWESEDEMAYISGMFKDIKEKVFDYMGNAFSKFDINHMKSFSDLTSHNKKKVIVYTENLLDIQRMEEEQVHTLPIAAHRRTDIAAEDITDEMKQHDMDIMNDLDF